MEGFLQSEWPGVIYFVGCVITLVMVWRDETKHPSYCGNAVMELCHGYSMIFAVLCWPLIVAVCLILIPFAFLSEYRAYRFTVKAERAFKAGKPLPKVPAWCERILREASSPEGMLAQCGYDEEKWRGYNRISWMVCRKMLVYGKEPSWSGWDQGVYRASEIWKVKP